MDARILTSEFCLRRYLFCLTLILLALTLTKLAAADTYTPYPTVTLGYGSGSLDGLTSTGVQVVSSLHACPDGTGVNCFFYYDPNTGSSTYTSEFPSIPFDNGAPCSPSNAPSLFSVHSYCNGSYQVTYGNTRDDRPFQYTLYLTPDGPGIDLVGGAVGEFALDSLGDVSFNLISNNDLYPDHVYGFIDTTNHPVVTPEPSSIALFCTGLTGIFAASRRRRIQ